LATIACPSCFGMNFLGARFCSKCGTMLNRAEEGPDATRACPRCGVPLSAAALGNVTVHDCPKCEGIWVEAEVLREICADREKQALVLGAAGPLPQEETVPVERVRYLPCPVCRKLMNRVNFAHCSHVVVDVCREHGTWFDKDELRRIVEFLRAGGMEAAREMEMAELEEARRKLLAAKTADAWRSDDSQDFLARRFGIGAAGSLLKLFLR
jgi:Zn-finger nucleic acid-binding protein